MLVYAADSANALARLDYITVGLVLVVDVVDCYSHGSRRWGSIPRTG